MLGLIRKLIPGGTLTAIGAGVVAILGIAWRIFSAGKTSARNAAEAKEAKTRAKSAEDQLEMHREATKIEREARDLSHEEALREAMRWSKHR